MYKKPDWIARHLFNPAITFVTGRLGISLRGSRILVVRGRKTGELRSVPVNPLTLEGQRYLVAPRGDTHWARNLHVALEGDLRLGRSTEHFRAEPIDGEARIPIIRAYLKRWARETKSHFGVTGSDVTDGELRRIAPHHPVFRLLP